jgi:hypothetical protein
MLSFAMALVVLAVFFIRSGSADLMAFRVCAIAGFASSTGLIDFFAGLRLLVVDGCAEAESVSMFFEPSDFVGKNPKPCSKETNNIVWVPVNVSKRVPLCQALVKTLLQNVTRQVNANEYHFAQALLIVTPNGAQIAAHELVHALKNHFSVNALHV